MAQVKRPIPTEIDDEPEHIDLSSLISPAQDAGELKLNERIIIEQPVEWWINDSGDSVKMYEDGRLDGRINATSKYRSLCCLFQKDTSNLWRSSIGERVRPTQVISLLTQNPTGGTRSPHFCYKWDQTDEAYYKAQAKRGLAEFIADTRPNYYCVPEDGPYRWMFNCPELKKEREKIAGMVHAAEATTPMNINEADEAEESTYLEDNCDYGCGHTELPSPRVRRGDILIYVDPMSGQASYVCPRCTHKNKKIFGGTGYPVKHSIDRELREKLSSAGIIPVKEYKNKKHTDREANEVLSILEKLPRGISAYQIDKTFGWHEKTTQRLVNKYLKDVVVERTKNGKKRLYLTKKR